MAIQKLNASLWHNESKEQFIKINGAFYPLDKKFYLKQVQIFATNKVASFNKYHASDEVRAELSELLPYYAMGCVEPVSGSKLKCYSGLRIVHVCNHIPKEMEGLL